MREREDIRFTSRRLITPTGRAVVIRNTPLQEAIFAWVGLLEAATVDQLCLVLARQTAGERNYLYRLLRKMFDLGLLAKQLLAGKDVYLLPQNKVENLAHAVGVSEVVARFAVAFKSEGIEVIWIKDREAIDGVLPDAWAVVEKPKVLALRLFCFEFQRSKKSLAQMRQKLASYDLAELTLKRNYQVGAVYRLFVLSERFDSFCHSTIRKLGRSAHGYAFVTSDRNFTSTKPENLLTAPIWWQAYEDEKVPIFVRRKSL